MPLLWAAYQGNLEVAQVLVEAGAALSATDKARSPPLPAPGVPLARPHGAACFIIRARAPQACRWQAPRLPCDPPSRNRRTAARRCTWRPTRGTSSWSSCCWSTVPTCWPLRTCGGGGWRLRALGTTRADQTDAPPLQEDWTALHAASDKGHADVVKLLLESGADPLAKGKACWDWRRFAPTRARSLVAPPARTAPAHGAARGGGEGTAGSDEAAHPSLRCGGG